MSHQLKKRASLVMMRKLSMKRGSLELDSDLTDEMIDETECLVQKFIDSTWHKYDKNNSNLLEKNQAVLFIKDVFNECMGDDGIELTDDDLEMLFEDLDLDQNNCVSREEFRKLIRDSTGL